MAKPIYLLDSDVFIQAKNLHYRFEFCEGFWDLIAEAHKKKLVYSIDKLGRSPKAVRLCSGKIVHAGCRITRTIHGGMQARMMRRRRAGLYYCAGSGVSAGS